MTLSPKVQSNPQAPLNPQSSPHNPKCRNRAPVATDLTQQAAAGGVPQADRSGKRCGQPAF